MLPDFLPYISGLFEYEFIHLQIGFMPIVVQKKALQSDDYTADFSTYQYGEIIMNVIER